MRPHAIGIDVASDVSLLDDQGTRVAEPNPPRSRSSPGSSPVHVALAPATKIPATAGAVRPGLRDPGEQEGCEEKLQEYAFPPHTVSFPRGSRARISLRPAADVASLHTRSVLLLQTKMCDPLHDRALRAEMAPGGGEHGPA